MVPYELERLVLDAVKEQGCRLYHLGLKGTRLEVFVDKQGGATVGDCERISRLLSLTLASGQDEWRNLEIEVSTPGIERRLYVPDHYRASIGEHLELKLEGELLEGRLVAADFGGIQIETAAGFGRRIKYTEILTAHVRKTTEELFKRR